jgi:NAD(P) transhydrogenase subunit alpha
VSARRGFGKFLHTGNEADVSVVDFLEYCEHDAETQAICMYIEGLRDGRRFLEVARRIAQANVVITTALIPGRAAPVLVTEEMVKSMQPGSVLVDLAAPAGGNCPLTEPGRTVVKHGVTLVGEVNLPALVAADSSSLYARNVLDFLKLITGKDGSFNLPTDDDIVTACLVTHAGEVKRA